jgi:hypothetical protein
MLMHRGRAGAAGDEVAMTATPEDAGDEPAVVCVITRFGLRSARHLAPSYVDFRRVMQQVERSQTPGLLRAAFLVENPTTCYTLSLWTGAAAIPHFGTNIPAHVDAGNRMLGRLQFDPERGPELWSSRWRLLSVSNNRNWQGLDLRTPMLRTEE